MTGIPPDSGVGVIYSPQSDGTGPHALRVTKKVVRRIKNRFKI
jgi:hypothetical protein